MLFFQMSAVATVINIVLITVNAFVRFFSSMLSHMSNQIVFEDEAFPTIVASQRFVLIIQVEFHMGTQLVVSIKTFAANITLEWVFS